MRTSFVVFASLGLGACTFNEGLEIYDLTGTVVLPQEAAVRTIDIDGVPTEVEDVRLQQDDLDELVDADLLLRRDVRVERLSAPLLGIQAVVG